MSNSNFLWEIIIKNLKNELSDEVFSTWILPNSIETVDMKNKTISITSSNSIISDYLKNIFDYKIKDILKKSTALDFDIYYNYFDENILKEDTRFNDTSTKEAEEISLNHFLSKNKPSGAQHLFKKQSFVLDEYKAPEQVITKSNSKNTSLNKNFRFDNFVIGPGNEYAVSLANVAAEYPGENSPLFIYGGVGLGKTHLLHAIGNELETNFPDFKIMCVTSEKFLNDYIGAIQTADNHKKNDLAEKFRKKYREVDALLIDDVQFFSDKRAIQTQFFETFNELQLAQKQIVLISDREPHELDGLEERLVSRFDSGAIADITPPDFEHRYALIKLKAEHIGLNLDTNAISFIAGNITSNVRQIEGILKELKFKSNKNDFLTLDQIEESIKKRVKVQKKVINPEEIINITAAHFSVAITDILSSKRNKEIVKTRMIAIYLCRELTDLSLPDIGKVFKKDHSSVHYSITKISSLIISNQNDILEDIETIKDKLKNI